MTYHFTRKEFECKCGCGFDTVDYELINALEASRTYFGMLYGKVKVIVTGGNRCVEHNETIQKKYVKNYVPYSSKSTHMEAKAADHKHYYFEDNEWIQISPKEVYAYYDKKYPTSKGIGLYHNRIHFDSRRNKTRW